jgi:hypothetical protein
VVAKIHFVVIGYTKLFVVIGYTKLFVVIGYTKLFVVVFEYAGTSFQCIRLWNWLLSVLKAYIHKTDRHDIIAILLKVALSTINQTKPINN